MPTIDEVQRLRAEIRVLQLELEQARVSAEDGAGRADNAHDEADALRRELIRVGHGRQVAEISVDELRRRLAAVVGEQEAERATRGAAEEELQIVVEELEAFSEELQNSNEELRLTNADLDARVAARTRELGEANAALGDRELRLSLAMQHARACSWDWQLDDGKISLLSGEHADLYGGSGIASLQQWLAAVLPEDRARLQTALHLCAGGHAEEVSVEYRIRHEQHGRRWLSSRGCLVRSMGGVPARVSGLTTDVTESKNAEALLRRSNDELSRRVAEAVFARESVQEQLFQKQKLEALGQLTGGVAHDFNNLLAVISNGFQLVGMADDADERRRLIERMQNAVDRGSVLTRRLLAFGRRQSLTPEMVDPRRCTAEFLDLIRPLLGSRIEIHGRVDAGTFPLWIDANELQLAMINLCVNARDAMPDGGRIELRIRNRSSVHDANEISSADFVEISVTDNGRGMSAEVLRHVFEPFFTTKDVGEGTGLGLAQVYGFVSQSGGTVHAASKPGEGTTITMLLPRAIPVAANDADDSNADASADPSLQPDGRSGASILMVEDDEELGPLVEQMLQRKFRVHRVVTAHAALERLRDHAADYDLLFTDIRLPAGMNGLQLAQQVRERYPNIAVVVTTGYGGSLIAEAMTFGLPVLRKPYRFDELVSLLNTALPAA
jgi:signal transduction histidine kinase